MLFSKIKGTYNPGVVGVIGGNSVDEATLLHAEELGAGIAGLGCVLVTGGGGGVMRAACRGAHNAGGLVIGILPSDRQNPMPGYPNDYVHIPIYTGLSDARNIIIAKTPDVIVALEGAFGTISEIAVALKAQTPVISLSCPQYDLFRTDSLFISVVTVTDAMEVIRGIIKTK